MTTNLQKIMGGWPIMVAHDETNLDCNWERYLGSAPVVMSSQCTRPAKQLWHSYNLPKIDFLSKTNPSLSSTCLLTADIRAQVPRSQWSFWSVRQLQFASCRRPFWRTQPTHWQRALPGAVLTLTSTWLWSRRSLREVWSTHTRWQTVSF